MATEWKCRSCTGVFETRGRRDAHHRFEHQGLANGTEGQSRRSMSGRFECQCGKAYQRAQELKRHQKKCETPVAILEATVVEEEGTHYGLH